MLPGAKVKKVMYKRGSIQLLVTCRLIKSQLEYWSAECECEIWNDFWRYM